jgi:outer membrane protein TolC
VISENANTESLKAAKTRYEVGVGAKADALQAQTAFKIAQDLICRKK